MESSIRHQYDAELALQPVGSSAITATADAANDLDLYRLTAGRGDLQGRYGLGSFDLVFQAVSVDEADADETYTIAVSTVDAEGNNPVEQYSFTVTGADVGNPLVFAFHPETLRARDEDAAQLRVSATLAGTSPSLQYFCFAAPHSHA